MRAQSDPPRKILVTRTDRLGDVVLALPVIHACKQRWPDCEVWMLVRPYTAPIAGLCPDVSGVLTVTPDHQMPVEAIRAENFDTAIVLYPRWSVARGLRRAGIPRRVGTAYRVYSLYFTNRAPIHRKPSTRHETEYNLALRRPLGIEDPAVAFHLSIPAAEQRQADDILESLGVGRRDVFIVLHPGSGQSAGNWPPEFFADLAARIVERYHYKVLVTGADGEFSLVAEVVDGGCPDILNTAGKFSLAQFAAVLQRAACVVGNSSGPLHLARALDTLVLGLYPTDTVTGPVRWGPYGRPDAVLTPGNGPTMKGDGAFARRSQLLATITVDQVFERMERLLQSAGAPPQTLTDERVSHTA